jgi:arylsulfatase A-like enzyme
MKRKFIYLLVIISFFITNCSIPVLKNHPKLPNIIIVYLDDLGYGDLSCYNSFSRLQTPVINKLANEGVRFTNGYATSATCTPSRYALLTGRYPWRISEAKVLPGTAPLIIDTTLITLPKILQKRGYHTSVIGKWHLGLGLNNLDWNKRITPGPNETGFDYSFILAATQDRVPTVYIKNGYVVGAEQQDPIQVNYQKNFEGEPTGLDNPELLRIKWEHGHNNSITNGIPRIGFMKGGKNSLWVDEDMADVFIHEVKAQIRERSTKNAPFFLYYAMQQPHVPRTPHARFVGKSGLGPRGDVILEADWCLGELMKTLKETGQDKNTLIIFSSDNGPVLNDGYYDDAVELNGAHDAAGGLRGGKYSLFEGGTKVPFFTWYSDNIKPKVCHEIISQMDLLASLAHLTGSTEKAQDSQNFSHLLLGKKGKGREELVLEASGKTAFRWKNYVLIPPYKGPAVSNQVNIELGNDSTYQLYDLSIDPGQKNNIYKPTSQIFTEMKRRYKLATGKS